MNNVVKFIGTVVGIVVASVVIDKVVDKIYENSSKNTSENTSECADTENESSASTTTSAATCKIVIKAVAGAALLIAYNKHTAKKVCDVAFKYGVEGGIRCTASAFVDFGLSEESGRQILTNTDTLIRFRDKVLPTAKQAYFG